MHAPEEGVGISLFLPGSTHIPDGEIIAAGDCAINSQPHDSHYISGHHPGCSGILDAHI